MLFDSVIYEQWRDRAYALAHTFRENLYWVAPYPTTYISSRKQVADIFGNILDEELFLRNGSTPDRVVLTNSISSTIIPKMNIYYHTFIIKYKNDKEAEFFQKVCEDLGYPVSVFKKAPAAKKIIWDKDLKPWHRAYITFDDKRKLTIHEEKAFNLYKKYIYEIPCSVKEKELDERHLLTAKEFLAEMALQHVVHKGRIDSISLYRKMVNYNQNQGMIRLFMEMPLYNESFLLDRKLKEKSKYHWETILRDALEDFVIRNRLFVVEELQQLKPSKHIKKVLRRSPVYDPNNEEYAGTMYDLKSVIDLYLFRNRDKYAKIYHDLLKGKTYD